MEHLPSCNMTHDEDDGTCRSRIVVGGLADVTVQADGPCTHSGIMEIAVSTTAYTLDHVDQLIEALPEIQLAIATQREVMADWEQRSLCQHPEDQPCL